MFDYYLRMMPFLRARSDALLPSTNSSVGFWQVETATVFGAYSEVRLVESLVLVLPVRML